jgi:nicotinamidase-related amidase
MIMAEPDDRIWNQFITERDRGLFVSAGFGRGAGWGVRPALVVIDVTYAFTGEGEPVEESIKRYPLSCGTEAWAAIEYNRQVLDAARQARIPVFYTLTELRPDLADVGGWSAKNLNVAHRSMLEGHKVRVSLMSSRRPRVKSSSSKKKPSAFFGTPLLSYLIDRAVDKVIITG